MMVRILTSLLTLLLLFAVTASKADDNGEPYHVNRLHSPFQARQTQVRVLLPDDMQEGQTFRVLYVLPVEAGDEERYGNGLREVQRHDLHNKHELICVAPTFSHLPWYADHPTDKTIRQESYLLKDVLPLIERTYPTVKGREGRLLVGFSKSGCGAWSLLLRHPDVFSRAAAWDAPLMMDAPGKYGSGPIFGTAENFEKHHIESLLKSRGPTLGKNPRLVLTGYDAFREHHVTTHQLMSDLDIPHVYRDGPFRKHTWHSGWLAEAIQLLTD